MFIVQDASDKPIDWPVTVEYAAPGGKIVKHTFTGYFKVLDDDQREAMLAADNAPKAGAEPDETAEPAAINAWKDDTVDRIMQVMTGWTGIVDQKREPIEFTRDNLRTVARKPQGLGVLRGISTAIAEIAQGARAKN